jgi:7-cyano-7-deazaguanine synthase in queuosine biosynthesis
MTLIIELSPDKEATFKAQAQAMDLSIEQWHAAACRTGGHPVAGTATRFAPGLGRHCREYEACPA